MARKSWKKEAEFLKRRVEELEAKLQNINIPLKTEPKPVTKKEVGEGDKTSPEPTLKSPPKEEVEAGVASKIPVAPASNKTLEINEEPEIEAKIPDEKKEPEKKPEEKQYKCPNCDVELTKNQETCPSCEATIGWDEDE